MEVTQVAPAALMEEELEEHHEEEEEEQQQQQVVVKAVVAPSPEDMSRAKEEGSADADADGEECEDMWPWEEWEKRGSATIFVLRTSPNDVGFVTQIMRDRHELPPRAKRPFAIEVVPGPTFVRGFFINQYVDPCLCESVCRAHYQESNIDLDLQPGQRAFLVFRMTGTLGMKLTLNGVSEQEFVERMEAAAKKANSAWGKSMAIVNTVASAATGNFDGVGAGLTAAGVALSAVAALGGSKTDANLPFVPRPLRDDGEYHECLEESCNC